MRKLLEDFARQRNLNPLSADTWYSILRKFIIHQKVNTVLLLLLFYYFCVKWFFRGLVYRSFKNKEATLTPWSRSFLKSILMSRSFLTFLVSIIIFILLGLSSHFNEGGYLLKVQRRREMFDNFAKEIGIDPLVPENWYSIPRELLLETPVWINYLFYHHYFI